MNSKIFVKNDGVKKKTQRRQFRNFNTENDSHTYSKNRESFEKDCQKEKFE